MNAEDARAIPARKDGPIVVTAQLEFIFAKIRVAASYDLKAIRDPFKGMIAEYPTPDQVRAIWAELRQRGYVVDHSGDIDPADPEVSPATTISW